MTILLLSVVGASGVCVAVMLVYMCFGSAERNGWRRLAKRYRLRGRFTGSKVPFRTATLNGFAFHMVLVLGTDGTGLYLRPTWLLRAFHPPLLIPWPDLTARRVEYTHHTAYRLDIAPDTADGVVDEAAPADWLEWSESTHRLAEPYLLPRDQSNQ